jgi:hypothetical protein
VWSEACNSFRRHGYVLSFSTYDSAEKLSSGPPGMGVIEEPGLNLPTYVARRGCLFWRGNWTGKRIRIGRSDKGHVCMY